MKLNSPFEQFIITNNYINTIFFNTKMFINNILIISIMISLILILFYYLLGSNKKNYNVNIMVELYKIIYIFIYTNCKSNLTLKMTNVYFPFYLFLFFFIMISNIIGILPYSFAITSHFIITFTLSFVVCYSNLLIGFKMNGLKFFNILFARGVPFVLIPFLIIIETISYLFRSISLALRLFANIVAGHILLDTLNLFIYKTIFIKIITFKNIFFGFFIILFSIILLFFEIFVAILQAYIFVILSLIFLRDAFVSH